MFAVNLLHARDNRQARRQTDPDCLLIPVPIKLDCEDVVVMTSYAEVAVNVCTLESGMHIILSDFRTGGSVGHVEEKLVCVGRPRAMHEGNE